ncbi:MAG: hypothetical protein RLO04_11355 [Limnobacter sp.]|uniref:hypothetical protein n=1 Tax=Limnobacter sp. TaxID=2003368 RepID=UPI0032EC0101
MAKNIKTIQPEQIATTIAAQLAKQTGPAVTQYELACLVYQSLPDKKLATTSAKKQLEEVLGLLQQFHLIRPIEPFTETRGYQLFGHERCTVIELACSLDPFAYVSHLSAMEHYGLTDRFSQLVYLTRPKASEWAALAKAKMERDLGKQTEKFLKLGYPKLIRPTFQKLAGITVNLLERSNQGAFRTTAHSSLRVATIGRVFLDMLREPALCGGLQHVVDIYTNHAKKYLAFVVDELNTHGAPIDKVRAGYLLSEVCKLDHLAFADWEKFAQRGGSRKLDPEGEFEPFYSERWKLSINLPSLLNNENTFE